MRPDKTQSGIDALRILASAINKGNDIHIRRNGDIREKRLDERFFDYLGINKTPKDWEISAKNRIKEKISEDLGLLKNINSPRGNSIPDKTINEFIENYIKNVKSTSTPRPIIDKEFQKLNNELLLLSETIHGKNTVNFRTALRLTGGSSAAAVQISMFANDLKKRWGLTSGHALSAGFQVWHLCKNNTELNPEEAFHVALTAGKLVKKQVLNYPRNQEELKSNLDAAAEIVQASLKLKESHDSPDPLAHACQRYLARERLTTAIPSGIKPNLIEGNPVKKRYNILEPLKNEFIKSMTDTKISATEKNNDFGVTKQFHRECIGNPFAFTFPDLTSKSDTSASVCITHRGLKKTVVHKDENGMIYENESSSKNVEHRQFDVRESLGKLAECSAELSGNSKKSAEIKLYVSRIFEQATLNHAVALACSTAVTSRGEGFLLTHSQSKYPIAVENADLKPAYLQNARIDSNGDLIQELSYFSRIFSIQVDDADEIPVNRYINPEKPIDPDDPATFSSKVFFKMKYLASDLASGITKPEIQEAYVEHSFDMSSSVMELL